MLNAGVERGKQQHARQRPPDAAAPAREQRSADHDDGDRLEIVDAVAPDPRRAGTQAAREIEAR